MTELWFWPALKTPCCQIAFFSCSQAHSLESSSESYP